MCCDDDIPMTDILMAAPLDDAAPAPRATCHWGRPRDGAWLTECGVEVSLTLMADPDAIRFCPSCGGHAQKPRVLPRPAHGTPKPPARHV